MRRPRTEQDDIESCCAHLATIQRAAHSYLSRRPLHRVEHPGGFVRLHRILSGSGNRKLRMSSKPDEMAEWVSLANEFAERARRDLNAGNMAAFAYNYGHAVSAFNHPFFEIGLRVVTAARAGGQKKSEAQRDRELAQAYLLAKAQHSDSLPKLTMGAFASKNGGMTEETGRKAIRRGLKLLDEKTGR